MALPFGVGFVIGGTLGAAIGLRDPCQVGKMSLVSMSRKVPQRCLNFGKPMTMPLRDSRLFATSEDPLAVLEHVVSTIWICRRPSVSGIRPALAPRTARISSLELGAAEKEAGMLRDFRTLPQTTDTDPGRGAMASV